MRKFDFIFSARYNAKVRASAYHTIDWHLQFVANMDCHGIGEIRRIASIFENARQQVS